MKLCLGYKPTTYKYVSIQLGDYIYKFTVHRCTTHVYRYITFTEIHQ